MTETKTEESNDISNSKRTVQEHSSRILPDLQGHMIFWPLMLGGLALDIWSKKAVFDWLEQQPSRSVSIIDGFLRFVIAINDGAAFGLFSGRTNFLTVISFIALAITLGLFFFGRVHQKIVIVALSLIFTGVCGNLYDRIFNDGLVRDFIDVFVQVSGREYHWHTFNVADSLLCIGVGLIVISIFLTGKSSQKHAQQQK